MRTYFWIMVVRLITLLAVVALTAFTLAAPAHIAPSADNNDHSRHVGAAAQAPVETAEGHVDLSDQGTCELICSGLAYHPASPDEGVAYIRRSAKLPGLTGAILAGQSTAVSEHPPKLRLL